MPTKMATIICPFCNEKGNIKELIERIFQTLNKFYSMSQIELLMVDDGSSDGGGGVVDKLTHVYPWVKLIGNESGRGKAAALSAGFFIPAEIL